jgi:transposase
MATALLPNALLELIEPLLPPAPSRPNGGRPRVSDRACLTGILFVLRSGIPWQMLPQELRCGSGMTCGRRLRDWQADGVWDLMHFALLNWLAREGDIDWSRAIVDNCTVRAVYGGMQTSPDPTDRGKRGSKRHLICDAQGVLLAVRLTGANRHDSQEALALVDAVPPSRVHVDGHGMGQIAWLATAATMRWESDTGYELVAFCQCGRCAARHTGAAWDGGGGSSNGRSHG